MSTTRPHLVKIGENTKGRDLIIGDVHGSYNALAELIKHIKPEDRLFIVGDLVDRGENSPGIFKLLRENSNIFSIRGNHETLCINAIATLEWLAALIKPIGGNWQDQLKNIINETIAKNLQGAAKDMWPNNSELYNDPIVNKMINDLQLHLLNGGQWLVDKFINELKSNDIDCQYNQNQLILNYSKESEIGLVKNTMNNLPYIMHVEGKLPFNIVHADMPFSDKELFKRLTDNYPYLSEQEINYATWARQFGNVGRNKDSILAAVGHNIIKDAIQGTIAPAVRADTNTIDLDVGAFETKNFLILSIENGVAQAFTLNPENKLDNPYNEIMSHLRKKGYSFKESKAEEINLGKETQDDGIPERDPTTLKEDATLDESFFEFRDSGSKNSRFEVTDFPEEDDPKLAKMVSTNQATFFANKSPTQQTKKEEPEQNPKKNP
jgi:hypothetical protein